MAEDRFNPLDPLGIFGRRRNPDYTSERSEQMRRENTDRFLAELRTQVSDEAHAFNEYTRLANVAEQLGFTPEARTLLAIARTEGQHRTDLESLVAAVERQKGGR